MSWDACKAVSAFLQVTTTGWGMALSQATGPVHWPCDRCTGRRNGGFDSSDQPEARLRRSEGAGSQGNNQPVG